MVHDTDIVELELRSKRFSLAVRKKEAIEALEPQVVYQVCQQPHTAFSISQKGSQYQLMLGPMPNLTLQQVVRTWCLTPPDLTGATTILRWHIACLAYKVFRVLYAILTIGGQQPLP